MRPLLLSFLVVLGFSFIVTAQETIKKDTTCNFLKGIKFNNGTAIIAVDGYYDDYHRSGDESTIMILAKQKKLSYYDYGTNDAGCVGISFTPIGCNKIADGVINRRIKFSPKQVKQGDKLHITCLVFGDKNIRDNFGQYFFVITAVSQQNSAK